MTDRKNLDLRQGETYSLVVRWGDRPYVYKAISAIAATAPLRLSAAAHGVPNGWPVAVISTMGTFGLNAANWPPAGADWHDATVVDTGTIVLDDVNTDVLRNYVASGYVVYETPVDLAGYSARAKMKDRLGGSTLLTLTSDAGDILIDNVLKTITLNISAIATAALTWQRGVYDLEVVSPSGVVTTLLTGSVLVAQEVTT